MAHLAYDDDKVSKIHAHKRKNVSSQETDEDNKTHGYAAVCPGDITDGAVTNGRVNKQHHRHS